MPPADDPAQAAALRLAQQGAAGVYDAFISYSLHNRTWVEGRLVPMLQERGIRCFIESNFKIGGARPRKMAQEIKACLKTIVVLSKPWVVGDWTTFQGLVVQTLDPAAEAQRLLPILYQKCEVPLRLSHLTMLDWTLRKGRDQEFERLMAAILESDS